MKKVLVILGPTATGKTDLGLALAKKFNGELIACDSRQVYIGLDIGTGKLPASFMQIKKALGFWQIDGVKVWLYDLVEISCQYTVADYVKDANLVLATIGDKLPIVVGGTGLYLRALLSGLSNLSIPIDRKLRVELANLPTQKLQQMLKKLSLARWQQMNNSDKQNPRRLLRSIEILSMNTHQDTLKDLSLISQGYQVLLVGLTAPRDILYQNVDLRITSWLNQGIVEEVADLLENVGSSRVKQLGLEYRLITEFVEGNLDYHSLKEKIKSELHKYVRRQITWFKKEVGICWFDITQKDYLQKVERLVQNWYNVIYAKKN